jgi:hypothetical protein
MALELFEMRNQAGMTLQRAADWLRVSRSHLWNCERGHAKLTPDQERDVRTYYLAEIAGRMKRLVASLPADSEGPGEKAPPSE